MSVSSNDCLPHKIPDGAFISSPDNSGTRRKVGGLPPYMSVFELGFAGKGRIYFTKGRSQRHRIRTVGAKNTHYDAYEAMKEVGLPTVPDMAR